MANRLVEAIEKAYLKKEIPQFQVGDTVDVATRIIEGDKERIQVFSGTVIARKGRGINEIFTVRRIVNNEGVERIYPVNSPFIASVTVRRSGESRRAKLFFLRKRVGEGGGVTPKRQGKGGEAAAGGGGGGGGKGRTQRKPGLGRRIELIISDNANFASSSGCAVKRRDGGAAWRLHSFGRIVHRCERFGSTAGGSAWILRDSLSGDGVRARDYSIARQIE